MFAVEGDGGRKARGGNGMGGGEIKRKYGADEWRRGVTRGKRGCNEPHLLPIDNVNASDEAQHVRGPRRFEGKRVCTVWCTYRSRQGCVARVVFAVQQQLILVAFQTINP